MSGESEDREQNFLDEDREAEESGEKADPEEERHYEDAGELTGIPGGAWFDRKKVMVYISIALSVFVLLGIVFSSKSSKKKKAAAEAGWAANAPSDFLARELERSLRSPPPAEKEEEAQELYEEPASSDRYGFPAVTPSPPPAPAYYPPPPPQQPAERQRQPQLSPLVPRMEGSLFASQAAQAPAGQQAADPYAALLARAGLGGGGMDQASILAGLLAQQDGQGGSAASSFYNPSSGGSAISGNYLQEDLLWIGTIIPAVLETAINTDLPGNVIARVTQNIYDSQTGKNILIPQGTILIAKYNSSVSYQQRRVQVVWDTLIRPDGYQVELEGMNGVDPKGIAGLKAAYHENWFEYIKAAGIVSLFSLINSKMVEEVAKYGSNEMAAGVITSNAEFVKDLGGNLVSRAMNIQPTLTVDSGEKINVMLNKNIYLPPFRDFEVKQRYALE